MEAEGRLREGRADFYRGCVHCKNLVADRLKENG